ncbi:MAG: hypothetical protein KJ006_05980 [Thermoleophilia bacterium]|nr:hypothetical protein [Thermoleophilia bacterium]
MSGPFDAGGRRCRHPRRSRDRLRADDVGDHLLAGGSRLALILAFERTGSFLLRRPVDEILEGRHVGRGCIWPHVLLAYLTSPLVVGLALDAAR